jgi:hypothetical protein
MMAKLRVCLLMFRDSLGYCDPPFWPKFEYDNDPRLRWMIDAKD